MKELVQPSNNTDGSDPTNVFGAPSAAEISSAWEQRLLTRKQRIQWLQSYTAQELWQGTVWEIRRMSQLEAARSPLLQDVATDFVAQLGNFCRKFEMCAESTKGLITLVQEALAPALNPPDDDFQTGGGVHAGFVRDFIDFCQSYSFTEAQTQLLVAGVQSAIGEPPPLRPAESACDFSGLQESILSYLRAKGTSEIIRGIYQTPEVRRVYENMLCYLYSLPAVFEVEESCQTFEDVEDSHVLESVFSVWYYPLQQRRREVFYIHFTSIATPEGEECVVITLQAEDYGRCINPCGMVTKTFLPKMLEDKCVVFAGARNILPQPEALQVPYQEFLIGDTQPAYICSGNASLVKNDTPTPLSELVEQFVMRKMCHHEAFAGETPAQRLQWEKEVASQYAEFAHGNLW